MKTSSMKTGTMKTGTMKTGIVKTGTVKTMTCRDLGGPCDLEHRGEDADTIIKAQDRHLKEAERAGDRSHQQAREAMKSRWRHPKQSMGWYRDTKAAFEQLPAD